ncbi:MAG: carbohydrate porin [Prochlorococcus marinus CUG1434]|nr:carbohydrate porin [Prochlorococcus marinus CUG1434]
MKLFQKLIAAPAIISMASGFAVNAAEINSTDLGDYSNSSNLVSLGDFKSDTLFPGDWAYDSLKDLTNSPKFNGNSVTRLEAAAELNNLIAGGEGLMNGAAIGRLSDELGSELAIMKGRVDGLEARVNGIEAGAFSETTTMKGKAKFMIGGTDGVSDEAVSAAYFWEVDLNTSFTGEDNLNVEIETGNTPSSTDNFLAVTDFGKDSADKLKVSDINYTFPFGGWSITVGDSLDASKQFTGACSYENTVDALSDCGTGNSIAVGGDQSISAGYDLDNGFSFGVGLSAEDGETSKGIFTKEGEDIYALNAAYSADNYAFAIAYANVDVASYWGINASYSPDGFPTISGGYEFGDPDTGKDTTQFAVGLSSDLGPGEITIGMGTNGAITDGDEELYAYDLSYTYKFNDGMSFTPFAFIVEGANGGDDTTGIGAEIGFKF